MVIGVRFGARVGAGGGPPQRRGHATPLRSIRGVGGPHASNGGGGHGGPALLGGGQLLVDHLLEHLERLRPGDEHAVDQKGGRAAHPQRLNRQRFLGDLGPVPPRFQAIAEGGLIQPDLDGDADQRFVGEGGPVGHLVGEDKVVERPELALLGGALAGLGRPVGLGAQDGEMLVDEAHVTGAHVLFTNSTQRVDGKAPAVRSLEIAELDDGDRGVVGALEVARVGQDEVHQGRGGPALGRLAHRPGTRRAGLGGGLARRRGHDRDHDGDGRLADDDRAADEAGRQADHEAQGHGQRKVEAAVTRLGLRLGFLLLLLREQVR